MPTTKKRTRRGATKTGWWSKFHKVNGIISQSKLEPGQPPLKTPWARMRDPASVNAQTRNKCCPICSDFYPRSYGLKKHFVCCVRRNGNPQGYRWDGTLNDERRIGKEIAELYCTRDAAGDQELGTSTSDRGSDHDYRTSSYEPSDFCSDSQSSSSRSLAETPSLHHDRHHYTGASPQCWTRKNHREGNDITKRWDKEVADRSSESPPINVAERAETPWKAEQVNPSLHFEVVDCRNAYIYFRPNHQTGIETHRPIHFL